MERPVYREHSDLVKKKCTCMAPRDVFDISPNDSRKGVEKGVNSDKSCGQIKHFLFQMHPAPLQNRAACLIMNRNTKGSDRPWVIEQNITERRFDLPAG